ncbi:RING-H2 finger protein ATL5P [Hordeum vulgare]|nr:RING-H2 finger protein ATL5P [Hordeum vulgare]
MPVAALQSPQSPGEGVARYGGCGARPQRRPAEAGDAGELSHATLLWRAAKLSIYSVALVPLTNEHWIIDRSRGRCCLQPRGAVLRQALLRLLAVASLVITWLNLSNDVYDSDTGADKNNKESVVNIVGSREVTQYAANLSLLLGFGGLFWAFAEAGDVRFMVLVLCAILCGYVYQAQRTLSLCTPLHFPLPLPIPLPHSLRQIPGSRVHRRWESPPPTGEPTADGRERDWGVGTEVGSKGGGGGSLEDMELALDSVGGLEDGVGGLLLQHVPPGLPAGRGGLEAVGGVGLAVAELREGERRRRAGKPGTCAAAYRNSAASSSAYASCTGRSRSEVSVAISLARSPAAGPGLDCRLRAEDGEGTGDDDCGTVRDWIADCVAVGKVLVDMICVPDWAFEAVGLELRGMGQDTAYHPSLYLTTAQREAVEALIQELPKFMLKAVPTDCSECPICLEEFKVGNMVCGLPCTHNFHVECIDQWAAAERQVPAVPLLSVPQPGPESAQRQSAPAARCCSRTAPREHQLLQLEASEVHMEMLRLLQLEAS